MNIMIDSEGNALNYLLAIYCEISKTKSSMEEESFIYRTQ